VIRFVDKDKKLPKPSVPPSEPEPETSSHLEEFFRSLQPDMRRPKPDQDAIAAAMEAAQRLATETDAEQAAEDVAQGMTDSGAAVCRVCGHRNRPGNRFCAMCGVAADEGKSTRTEWAPEGEGLQKSGGDPGGPGWRRIITTITITTITCREATKGQLRAGSRIRLGRIRRGTILRETTRCGPTPRCAAT